MRAFYEALKAVHGLSHQIQAPLRSSDGRNLLKDKEATLQSWSEHFQGLFTDQHAVQGSLLAKIFLVDVKLKLDDPSTMQLNVGKSPGTDGIPTEVFQNGGEAELEKLQDLFINCRQRKGLYLRTPRMQSSSLGTNTREKNLTVQTTRHHPTLHCSHNLELVSCL